MTAPGVRSLLVATATSGLGNWFHLIASGILVFRLTGSGVWLAALTASHTGSVLLLGPLVGRASDQLDRRRVIATSQSAAAVAAFTLSGLAWLGFATPWVLVAVTPAIASGSAFGFPTAQAILSDLVPQQDLPRVVALNAGVFNITRVIGPAMAAVLIETAGPAPAFLVNGISFLPLALVAMTVGQGWPHHDAHPGDSSMASVARAALRSPTLRWDFLGVITIGFLIDPSITLAPPLAALYGADEGFVGLVTAAFGVGAVLTALSLRWLRAPSWPVGPVGLSLGGTALLGVALSPYPALALFGLAVVGVGYMLSVSDFTSRIQLSVDGGSRGRITALWAMSLLAGRLVAAQMSGSLLDLLSVRIAISTVGAVSVLVSLGQIWHRRRSPSP